MFKNKKDVLYCLLLAICFVLFVVLITKGSYIYGSTIDWSSQHTTFPEYFRTMFYKTGDLFPDFAWNIGSGQNIYNFSYYGLLSPIILVSYFLPFISMPNYIVLSTILVCIVSSWLSYFWFKKHDFNSNISFISSFLLLFAACLTFHSHRHIMFINYMPFLIMGLFGVDKKLESNKNGLLIISVFLMCMTSYYYSVGGCIVLVLYGIYRYLVINDFKLKSFILDGIKCIIPIVLGVLCSSVILIPTFIALLSGRGDTVVDINIKDLLVPWLHTNYYLYHSYGIGLTAIILPSVVYLFKDKKKENIYLGIILLLALLFGIFNYLLNATMYLDSKSLIPLLPLCCYSIALFLNGLLEDKIKFIKLLGVVFIISIFVLIDGYNNFCYLLDIFVLLLTILLFKKFKKEIILIIPICLTAFISAYYASITDTFEVKKSLEDSYLNNKGAISNIVNYDKDLYRINTYLGSITNNNIYGSTDNYMTTVYSSLYNMNYNLFYFDEFNVNMQSRNRVITSNSNNILFNILSGSKYLVNSGNDNLIGYTPYKQVNGLSIYKNEDVLPLFYVNSNLISYDEYSKLSYPYNTDVLLKYVVVGKDSNIVPVSKIKPIKVDYSRFNANSINYVEDDGVYKFYVPSKKIISYKLNKKDYGKLIYVRFKMNVSDKNNDVYISINGENNKLTVDGWKYHNGNYIFDYLINEKDIKELNIKFSKGYYEISNIELYSLDYEDVSNVRDSIIVPEDIKIEKDKAIIKVNNKESGYLVSSIPYDNGFKILVDGKDSKVEKVNTAFVGTYLESGDHIIEIEYEAPFKKVSIVISFVAIVSSIGYCYISKKKV